MEFDNIRALAIGKVERPQPSQGIALLKAYTELYNQ